MLKFSNFGIILLELILPVLKNLGFMIYQLTNFVFVSLSLLKLKKDVISPIVYMKMSLIVK